MFIPFNMIQTGIPNFIPYLISDIPFELIMATTGFLTVLWMFKPLYKVLSDIGLETNKSIVNIYK